MSDQNPYSQPQYPQDPKGGQPGYGYPPPPPGQPGYGYPPSPPGQPGAGAYGQPGATPYGGQPGYGYPPPPAQPGGMYTGDPAAPYGYDPYGRPYSEKSRVVAGVLSLFLGGFGVGRFYTGHVGMALGQLFTCGGLGIWSLIDGIILLTNNNSTDSDGRVLRGG